MNGSEEVSEVLFSNNTLECEGVKSLMPLYIPG